MSSLTKDPNEGLLKALECPCCAEYMVPPIFLCENGHNICNSCKSKFSRCSDCNQPYLRSRNITLETITKQVEYPCKYRKAGCPNSFALFEIQEHQSDCSFGPFQCPVILPGRKRCPWKGTLNDMKKHFHENHKEELWENDEGITIEQMVSPSGLHNTILIKFGEIFYLQTRGDNGFFSAFVKYIGPMNKAQYYRSEISVCSKDENELITARYSIQGYKVENEEIVRGGNKFLPNTVPRTGTERDVSKRVPVQNSFRQKVIWVESIWIREGFRVSMHDENRDIHEDSCWNCVSTWKR
ncbi:hypothetical protein C0J52_24147 [Blattella germanica]|nr:hypothetical protein C0J52_24147 [Blattella germanica]